MKSEINVLPAFHGDCFVIKTYTVDNQSFTILVDGGTGNTFDYALKKQLKSIPKIDLIVLTHIDADHIMGMIRFFKNSLFTKIPVDKFWINVAHLARIHSGEKISYGQGDTIAKILIDRKVDPSKIASNVDENYIPGYSNGIDFIMLSPSSDILKTLYKTWPAHSIQDSISEGDTIKISDIPQSQLKKGKLPDLANKEFVPDKSILDDLANSSSIAFVLILLDFKILLLGDSRPEIVESSLLKLGYSKSNKLRVDYVKVSHHGSKNNTSCSLLDIIDCNRYIICTNGGKSNHQHPDRETIARIIYHPERDFGKKKTIFFNYSVSAIFSKGGAIFDENDLKDGNWEYVESRYFIPD